MPIKLDQRFESLVFKRGRRQEAISRGLTRLGKRFKGFAKSRQTDNEPSGRFYPSHRGGGFTTMHRASAWGEPPAPDTMNLVNAIEDRKVSKTVHEVYVDEGKAPYAGPLQEGLNRPIINEEVMDEFKPQAKEEFERVWRELSK
jgi:hypothetical protein